MLAVKRKKESANWDEEFKRPEINVIKKKEIVETDGEKIISYKEEKTVNLTRKINETAKVLKQQTAREKLELIAKAIQL